MKKMSKRVRRKITLATQMREKPRAGHLEQTYRLFAGLTREDPDQEGIVRKRYYDYN